MIAATVAAIAIAAAPSGFTEAKTLEPAASFVAGKAAAVYCPASSYEWSAYVSRYTSAVGVNGLTVPGSSETMLSPAVCSTLVDRLRRRWTDSYDLAAYILTLVHEAVHERGSVDEGQTECAAMHEMPRVAVKYFRVKAGKQLRALMSDAWAFHAAKPAAFRTVC